MKAFRLTEGFVVGEFPADLYANIDHFCLKLIKNIKLNFGYIFVCMIWVNSTVLSM